MKFDLPHSLAGRIPQVRAPLQMSAAPVTATHAPPLLGEHTAAVLRDRLGLADDALADLDARGVIGLAHPSPRARARGSVPA
jgi:crotonobetainyl-CoA:carnitine CoA-transferase CaiB-like acyl-CoA transferase